MKQPIFPKALLNIRKTIAQYLNGGIVEPEPHVAKEPELAVVHEVRKAVAKRRHFTGPNTFTETQIASRLFYGPATVEILSQITGLKHPRKVIARLRRSGLDIPCRRRMSPWSMHIRVWEQVYYMTPRDRRLYDRWDLANDEAHQRDLELIRHTRSQGQGGAQ